MCADSLNSFKNRLDKWWRGSDVMFNPYTNIYIETSARRALRTTPINQLNVFDDDLVLEA